MASCNLHPKSCFRPNMGDWAISLCASWPHRKTTPGGGLKSPKAQTSYPNMKNKCNFEAIAVGGKLLFGNRVYWQAAFCIRNYGFCKIWEIEPFHHVHLDRTAKLCQGMVSKVWKLHPRAQTYKTHFRKVQGSLWGWIQYFLGQCSACWISVWEITIF